MFLIARKILNCTISIGMNERIHKSQKIVNSKRQSTQTNTSTSERTFLAYNIKFLDNMNANGAGLASRAVTVMDDDDDDKYLFIFFSKFRQIELFS